MIRHEVRLIEQHAFTDEDLLTLDIDRTSELRKKGYVGRRLGPKQMTTDTAVRVTRIVVQEKGIRLHVST
jgi:ribosome biogenesis SPOUT family RNA methylase Rps3